jgi:translation initiation factor IF-1
MSKRDRITYNGIVTEDCHGKFKVKSTENHIITCTLSGSIKKNSIKVIPGDKVIVEVSEYDLAQGRIIKRIK